MAKDSDRIGVRRRLNEDWSPCSPVLRIWGAMPIFNAVVDIQHRFIAPCLVSRFGLIEIPVVLMTARPSHHVDAGSAAQNLAHGVRKGASVEVGIGLPNEVPVPLAPNVHRLFVRFHDAWHVIVAARLKQ